MTKEELAPTLNGLQYGEDISPEVLAQAVDNNLVIVFGHSDDLIEIAGSITDEGSCHEGGEFWIDQAGLLPEHDDLEDDELEEYVKRKKSAKKLTALWFANGAPAWTYKTMIPHVTFNILQDSEVQCRGIVFELAELS